MKTFVLLLEQELKEDINKEKEQLIAKPSLFKKSLTLSLPPVKCVFAIEQLLPPDYSERDRKCSSRHLYNHLNESNTFHANAHRSTQVFTCAKKSTYLERS